MRVGLLRKAKLLLPLVGVLAILGATTLITSPPARAFGGGTGSPSNPYQISTCEDLQNIEENQGVNFVLVNDVDCSATSTWNSGAGFIPISDFMGKLDGQNYTIHDLYVNTSDYGGLFGQTYQATIENLVLDTIHVDGGYYTGALSGYIESSKVSNVHIVNGASASADGYVGLIAGSANQSIISASSVGGTAMATTNSTGGIAGTATQSTIVNSYSNADITIDEDAYPLIRVGGLAGYAVSTIIANSYSAGSITAESASTFSIGGLAGEANGDIHHNFVTTSLQAAQCGSNNCSSIAFNASGQYTDNYFDQTAVGYSGCSASPCVAVNTDGLDPDYFKNNSTNTPLDTWNFSDIWQTTNGLPALRTDAPLETTNPAPTNVTVETLGSTSVRVTWDAAASPNVTDYQISHIVHDNPIAIYNGPGGSDSVDSNTLTYDITGLIPGLQLSVTVSARYVMGAPVASQPVEAVTTEAGYNAINTCEELQNITDNPADNYQLTKDIDCSDTVNWNDGRGFLPIGAVIDEYDEVSLYSAFVGILYGNNHTIRDIYQNGEVIGLFGYTQVATIQDVTLSDPVIHFTVPDEDGREATGGFITGTSYGSNLTNVHVTNGLLATNSVEFAGGLIGLQYATGTIARSSFQGSIIGSHAIAGGLMGAVVALGNGSFGAPTINDSYANVTMVLTSTPGESELVGAGGLVGYAAYREDENGPNDVLYINRSYATGDIDYSSATVNQFFGGLIAGGYQINIADSFSSMNLTGNTDGGNLGVFKGGILGVSSVFGDSPSIIINGVYAAGSYPCAGDDTASCTTVGDPSYFYNNHTNPPLDNWDFTNIWQTTGTYPTFIASTAPSPIIPNTTDISDLGPLGPIRFPSLFGGTTDTPTTAVAATSTNGTLRINNGGTEASQDTSPLRQVITAFKELVKSLPPGVVVAFPYALFALLGLGILALLAELAYELRRTHLLEALIHKQQLLAEERDAFWHLAANYLRAPVTLIVGGAEALRESYTNQTTTSISTLAATLQNKVGDIMKKIEGSTSLQSIKHAEVHAATKIARKASFIVPLLIVALLIILGDYAATSYRDLSPGLIGYLAQLIIFIVAAIALYWVLGLLTQGKNKRKATEELLESQKAELANARHDLINETATSLNPDLTKLEGQLAILPAATATAAVGAVTTLREGSSRLREIVTSFAMLIKVQEGTGAVNAATNQSVDLTGLLNKVRAKLTPQITSKGVQVSAPAMPLAVTAEADMANQVLESIIANAVDYSPANGKVTVEARQLQDKIQLRVSDQGQGIDKQQLDHLFQPFVRADGKSAMDMSHGGFGINLYLDKLIMEQMGGSITAASTPGKGTAITMEWPTA